ncbi:MAG: hypothetical protein ACXAC7_22525 [Candidatus Hodarchaeales archaeon]|jgi:hypothetical protein
MVEISDSFLEELNYYIEKELQNLDQHSEISVHIKRESGIGQYKEFLEDEIIRIFLRLTRYQSDSII